MELTGNTHCKGLRSNKYNREQKEAFLKVLEKNYGLVKYACEEYGIHRQTYYDWCEKEPWFLEEVSKIDDSTCQYVENQLYKLIGEGNDKAIMFWLRCRARNKGYNEHIQLDTNLASFIEFKFNMPQKEDKLLPFPSTAPYSLDSTQKADYELLNLNESKENVDKDDKESNAEEKDESIDDELPFKE